MQLTTRSRYGLRMLLDIALHGSAGPVRIQDIARRRNISVKYLEQLIRELKKSGLIVSKRGPRGGHLLAVEPQDVKVGEVVRTLEGRMALTECVADEKACPISSDCLTREIWERATNAMFRELDSITLADLLAKARRSTPLNLACC